MSVDAKSLSGLQMLRAIAAWLVVVHHYHQLVHDFDESSLIGKLLVGVGSYAVKVFFVISGFIMHRSLTERSQGAGEFLRRRLERIVPAYWLATGLFLICLVLVAKADSPWSHWDLGSLLMSLLFVPHEHRGGMGQYPVLTVGWSLNYEMFFYALLALMLWWRGRAWLVPSVVLLLGLVFLWPPSWPLGKFLGDSLLLYFVAGLAISHWRDRLVAWRSEGQPGASARLDLALCLLLVAWMVTYLGARPLPGLWRIDTALQLLSAAAAVGLAVRCERHVVGAPALRWLARLGDASYSTYLVHPIVLILLLALPQSGVGNQLHWPQFLVYLLFTWLLSRLFHRHVERWRWLRRGASPHVKGA